VHIVAAVTQAASELAAMDPDERARWFPL
jgi:hypothetical protein